MPAMAETIPGYDVSSWYAVLAPVGTPHTIIDKLNKEINAAVNEVKNKVDQIRSDLPEGILEPQVFKVETSSNPIAYFAVAADDMATQHRLLREFFMPYLALRNRVPGYAVSIVKAGAKLVGHDAGPVRAPLTDLKADELAQLDALIRKLGPQ